MREKDYDKNYHVYKVKFLIRRAVFMLCAYMMKPKENVSRE